MERWQDKSELEHVIKARKLNMANKTPLMRDGTHYNKNLFRVVEATRPGHQ